MDVSCGTLQLCSSQKAFVRLPTQGRDSATNDDTGRVFVKILFVKEKSNGQLKPTSSLTPILVFKFRQMTYLLFFF